jgi:hypothetical protein
LKKTLIILVSALIMLSNSGDANAQKVWDTLPDGRVVIQVFNERLAFDPKDTDIVTDEKPEYAVVHFERAGDGELIYMSLKQVIENREAAEAFFEAAKNTDSTISLAMDFGRNNLPEPRIKTQYEGLFLGKFPYADLYTPVPARALIFWIAWQANVKFERSNQYSVSDPYLDKKVGPDQFGITSYMPSYRGEAGVPGKPYNPDTLYIIPAELRLIPSQRDLVVLCGYFNKCSFSQIGFDLLVGMRFTWNSERLPEATWFRIDNTLRQLAAYIFIDRKPGDFQ